MDVAKHFGLSQNPFRTPEPEGGVGEALTPEAARAYLAGRAAGAGGRELFSPSALDLLAEASQGQPDRLRQLGGNALFHAAFEGAARVEDTHARQAAMAQGLWAPSEDPMESRTVVVPATAAPVPTLAPELAPADPEPAAADPVIVHRRWWRRTPPLTRLAIVVGLLLLSLPVIGFIIGAVKDSRSSSESSYLPDDSTVDAAPPAAPAAVAINPDAAAPPAVAVPDEAAPPAEVSRPPVDLLGPGDPPRAAPDAALDPDPLTGDEIAPGGEPVPADIAPEPAPVPSPEIETVPLDLPPPPEDAPPPPP